MRIGVDIDGVLNYRQEFVLAYGAKFCVEKGIFKGFLDADSHSIRQMYGMTQEERDEIWYKYTIDWLNRNGIEYDGIAFNLGRPVPNDKGTYCAEHEIEVMIDDLPEYLETMVGKTQIMIFDQPYNRKVDLPGAIRVYSWYDIYDKIRKMEAK